MTHYPKEQFLDLALEMFAKLSDDHGPLEFVDATPEKGIPHWHRMERIPDTHF